MKSSEGRIRPFVFIFSSCVLTLNVSLSFFNMLSSAVVVVCNSHGPALLAMSNKSHLMS